MWIAGGNFDNGVRCGSRCANSNNNPENVNSNVGLRCVCDHHQIAERAAMESPSPSIPIQGVSHAIPVLG